MSKIKMLCKEDFSYVTITDSYANKNTLDIYIKFMSCLEDDELKFLESLKDKDIFSLSQIDLDKYYRIRTQLNMTELLKKYKNRECTKEEHDRVIEYMENNPLKTFVRSKISINDKYKAQKFIENLSNESKESSKKYIELQESKYDELSIYDSYVLFELKEYLYNIEQNELNDRIRKESLERETKLRKSLIRDYGLM